jgi:predicted GNAT superfamily acetyltransferase
MAAGMTIRELTTIEECRQVAALEREIWAYDDATDVVPPPILIVSVKRGGILLGAFGDSGTMSGFVYSMPAVTAGRLTQWSHMLGVRPEARQAGLGVALKLAQRQRARARGIDLIEWTFDPLQAANAHLNFAKLGIVVNEYEEDVYGDSTSVLHRGSPTDRFIAEWRLDSPDVQRRIAGHGAPVARDARTASAPLVNSTSQGLRWLHPGHTDLSLTADRLLVEIPGRFTELQSSDPALALEWRLATRAVFQHYLSHGYRVVDFFRSRDSNRGQYLLTSNPFTAGA